MIRPDMTVASVGYLLIIALASVLIRTMFSLLAKPAAPSSAVRAPPPLLSGTAGTSTLDRFDDNPDMITVDEVPGDVPTSSAHAGWSVFNVNSWSLLQDTQSDVCVTLFDDAPSENKFREIIQTIADYSAVRALPALVFSTNRVVRLPSEKAAARQHSLTLSTSQELVEMLNVWFEELRKKDHLRDAQRVVPFHSIFKAKENRPSLKLFKSADEWIPMEAAKNPSLSYPWLVQPSDRFRIRECDVWHFETQCRQTLRAVNFAEADLQAISNPETPPEKKELLLAQLPLSLRSIAQIQAAVFGQLIQLRRDRYLALMQRIAPDDIGRLRHAPVDASNELFPAELLREINTFTKDFLHDSALLNMAGYAPPKAASHRPPSNANRPKNQNNSGRKQQQQPQQSRSERSYFLPKNTSPVHVEPPAKSEFVPTASSPSVPTVTPSVRLSAWLPVLTSELERLERLRTQQLSLPVGGRLVHFWQEWQAIGASRKVVRWFRKGYALPFAEDGWSKALRFFSMRSPSYLLVDYSSDPVKRDALQEKVQELLQKAAIEPLPQGQPAFFNRVFLVPKKTGGFRLILDVSKLNEFLTVESFVMDTVQLIRSAVEEGMWGVSVDLSDAYHHIPIHRNCYNFLAFEVGGVAYRYTALPFGLSPAPKVFTAALLALKLYARRSWGLPVFQYLDDWLILGRSAENTAVVSVKFVELCLRLGLLVNFKKSQLTPTQSLDHLVVEWDLRRATVRPSLARVTALVASTNTLAATMRAPLPLLESLRGQMVSMEKLVRHGRINFRVFQRVVTQALQDGRNHRWIRLPPSTRPNLLWWRRAEVLRMGVPATPPKPSVLVTTDASTQGWGATWRQLHLQGKWSHASRSLHINLLELTVVLLALEAWGTQWVGQAVRFLLDNRTAVSYVSKQGGTRSRSSTQLAERIFALADEFNICLSAAYLPG